MTPNTHIGEKNSFIEKSLRVHVHLGSDRVVRTFDQIKAVMSELRLSRGWEFTSSVSFELDSSVFAQVQISRCDIFVAVLDAQILRQTWLEYEYATKLDKIRMIFVTQAAITSSPEDVRSLLQRLGPSTPWAPYHDSISLQQRLGRQLISKLREHIHMLGLDNEYDLSALDDYEHNLQSDTMIRSEGGDVALQGGIIDKRIGGIFVDKPGIVVYQDSATTAAQDARHRASVYDETRVRSGYVTRHVDIACPRRVWVKSPRVSIVVRLTIEPSPHSSVTEKLAARVDLPVRVRVDAPAFEILGDQEQKTMVAADTDSPPLVFDLKPTQVGLATIVFDFLQAGDPLGTVSVSVEITAEEVSEAQQSHAKHALRGQIGADPPDLMLYIGYDYLLEKPALTFTLFRAGEVGRTFHSVPLVGDPMAQAERFYQWLTVVSTKEDPTAKMAMGWRRVLPLEDVDRRVKQFGQNLWRDLIPDDLKKVYADEREDWRGKTLLIVSDEPYMPWELIWPYSPGRWEDEAPWCISMRLTRWLRRDAQGNGHESPPSYLALKSWAGLAPTDSGLPAAQKERAFLTTLLEYYNVVDLSPATATWAEVMALLDSGEYNWMHVAAHGSFYADAPDTDSAIWLQGQHTLTPDAFVGATVEGHIKRRRPSFFFNACHCGREGWMLNHIGGWANRLVSTGAGLFIAPLWTVTDGPALRFAKAFYEQTLAGKTVGEAVRQARLGAMSRGDPTWLAYSVYAHPNARVAAGADDWDNLF